MSKYLNEDGLLYFWQKIKNTFANKESIPTKGTASPSMNGSASAGSATTYSASDHVHPSDTTKADKSTTYTKTEVDTLLSNTTTNLQTAISTAITGAYKYKGSVATISALPSSGNTTGDVYNVEAGGMNYAWNGTAWDALGETFTITSISNGDIDTIVAS